MKKPTPLKELAAGVRDLDHLLLIAANLAEDGNANALPQLAALLRTCCDKALALSEQATRLS